MHFCDEAFIKVKAGNGGDGCMSFRREKYEPMGGPDGGNGGDGGSIIFEADADLNTLVNYMSRKHFKGKTGEKGRGRDQYGHSGEDIILKVPMGTLIYRQHTGELLADLTRNGEQVVIAHGGLGGKGNANFTSSTRQAPSFAELGEPGEEKDLRLELKLIADVAIVGYPSVGKSTLISVISNARPKIADYPFTTLVPNLGVVKVGATDFVVADIPGLIEGAHEGKGLGIEFLKHIERTKLLVHLLDITHDDWKEEYKILNSELAKFSKPLSKKPQILVFNKIDATIPEMIAEAKKQFKTKKPLFISGVSREGLEPFLYRLKDEILALRKKERAAKPVEEAPRVFRPHLENADPKRYTVKKEEGGYRVTGKRIEQLAVMTDMTNPHGIYRLHDILDKIGAYRDLRRAGAQPGDKILIGKNEFEFMKIEH